MTKLLLLLFAAAALCLVVTGSQMSKPLVLVGSVFCDTCHVGFQTTVSPLLSGAHVNVICRKREAMSEVTFLKGAVTDSKGVYRMEVDGDFANNVCVVKLENSTTRGCKTRSADRDQSSVMLTRHNGMASRMRFANALGFLSDEPLASCGQVLKQYQETETDD